MCIYVYPLCAVWCVVCNHVISNSSPCPLPRLRLAQDLVTQLQCYEHVLVGLMCHTTEKLHYGSPSVPVDYDTNNFAALARQQKGMDINDDAMQIFRRIADGTYTLCTRSRACTLRRRTSALLLIPFTRS